MTQAVPSLALINAEIYPFAAPGRASAVLSRDGVVSALGADKEILAQCSRDTLVLDMRGAAVLPGFTDAGADFSAMRTDSAWPVNIHERLASLANDGVTLVQANCGGSQDAAAVMSALRGMEQSEALPLRVMPRFSVSSPDEAEWFIAQNPPGAPRGSHLALGPIDVELDGFLSDRTAALSGDYSDAPGYRGHLAYDNGELFEIVRAAHRAGRSIALRASGDAAIEQATDVFEAVFNVESRMKAAPRHRLTLCAAGNAGQYERIARLGVSVEIRPGYFICDRPLILSRLGSERARFAYAWKTLLQKRILVCAGSASPSVHPSPLRGMTTATTRRDEAGMPPEGWIPREALDRAEAFWLYTGGAGEALGLHAEHGTLEPGKAADMTALTQNPFRIPMKELPNVEIGMTIVGGRIRKIV